VVYPHQATVTEYLEAENRRLTEKLESRWLRVAEASLDGSEGRSEIRSPRDECSVVESENIETT